MAIFGVPHVREDDAVRAVRAAGDLRHALAALNEELERGPGVQLAVRIGVNTGEVVAGPGATFASGDAVNIAARLETAAEPGEILIGELTHRLVRDAVRFERVDGLRVKGKSDAVVAFRVLDVLADAPAFTRRLDAPFVGRERELAALEDAFARARDGPACELVTVVGEPGIGKSRLVRELVARVRDEARVAVGRCLPYGAGVTYRPLADVLEQTAGTDVLAGLADVLGEAEDASLVASRVAAAVGAADGGGPPEETQWAVRRLLEELARDRPLVVVLDDVHWAEEAFLDLIEYVAGFARDAPLLLVCGARPELLEQRPAWRGTTVGLESLPPDDAESLVERLLDGAALAEDLRARILAAAEGNPLFVEQMLAMAREAEDGDLPVPPTIQALLAERIDRLEPVERVVAECAAVEGRFFHRGAVAELMPQSARPAAASSLLALVRKDLVRPDRATFPGDDGFRFAHMLVRDAAYESLPKARRAELHERYARWLDQHPARATSSSATTSSRRPGTSASSVSPTPAGSATKRVGAWDRRGCARANAPTPPRRGTSSAVRRPCSPPTTRSAPRSSPSSRSRSPRAVRSPRATRCSPRPRRSRQPATRASARGSCSPARGGATRRVGARTLTGSSRRQRRCSPSSRGVPTTWVSPAPITSWRMSSPSASSSRGRRNCCVARSSTRAELGRRIAADILHDLLSAPTYGSTPIREAVGLVERVRELAVDEPLAEMRALRHLGRLRAKLGDFDEARRLMEQGRVRLAELGFEAGTLVTLVSAADIELDAGEPEAAERLLRELGEAGDLGRRGIVELHYATALAEALIAQGRFAEAERFVDLAARVRPDVYSWRLLRARVLAARGELEEAEALVHEAIEHLDRSDRLDARGDARVHLAEILRLAGRYEEALTVLDEALALYERRGNLVGADRAAALVREIRASAPA
ncbi:MAG: AAA family ATPase [Thermoleophilia bacterium]|nr:AAA family ATPase [Thermoleophilia bacterium]